MTQYGLISYNQKELKDIVIELKGLGCPIWKIAKLLRLSEAKVVQLAGIEQGY